MCHLPWLAGIGGQDDAQSLFQGLFAGQCDPAVDLLHDMLNAARHRLVQHAREFQRFVIARGLFERGDGGENAPVHFGQDHMHRQIRRRQAAIAIAPRLFGVSGDGRLKHWHAQIIKRGGAIFAFARKGGRVDNRRRIPCRQLPAQPTRRIGRLERGHKEALHGIAFALEFCLEGGDGFGIGRHNERAIKGNCNARFVVRAVHQGHGAARWPILCRPCAHLWDHFSAAHRLGIDPRGQGQLRQGRPCRAWPPNIAQILEPLER